MPVMDFGHTNEARIGERHRRVPVFLHQPAQCVDMLLDPQRNLERAILQKLEQGVLRLRIVGSPGTELEFAL